MYIAAAPLSLGVFLGVVGFFSFILAPAAARLLPEEHAGRLIGGLLPTYYLILAIAAAAAGIGLVAKEPWMSKLMLIVAAVAAFCRQLLLPALEKSREKARGGDAGGGGGRRLALLEKASTGLNYAMLGAGLVATVIHV